MIRKLRIEGFKSLAKVELELGRLNVFIGENGAGKSNLLEALAFGAAASAGQLSHEFLASRGVRSVTPDLMFCAFPDGGREIVVAVDSGEKPVPSDLHLKWDGKRWQGQAFQKEFAERLLLSYKEPPTEASASGSGSKRPRASFGALLNSVIRNEERRRKTGLATFLAFSPEYTALRTFEEEGAIRPLGVNGQGLFAHLKDLANRPDRAAFDEITAQLDLLDWFEGFELPKDLAPGERTLRIRDRYLTEQVVFDQRSANEGFLFLLFYFTLVISPETPKVFAIDNIDASLNPKLCITLIQRLAALAKKHDKQMLLTTHNPAVLDGLDLNDDEQRLFTVSRDSKGQTRVKRVPAPKPLDGDAPIRLSEAFMRGYLGGLPRNF